MQPLTRKKLWQAVGITCAVIGAAAFITGVVFTGGALLGATVGGLAVASAFTVGGSLAVLGAFGGAVGFGFSRVQIRSAEIDAETHRIRKAQEKANESQQGPVDKKGAKKEGLKIDHSKAVGLQEMPPYPRHSSTAQIYHDVPHDAPMPHAAPQHAPNATATTAPMPHIPTSMPPLPPLPHQEAQDSKKTGGYIGKHREEARKSNTSHDDKNNQVQGQQAKSQQPQKSDDKKPEADSQGPQIHHLHL